MRVSWLGLRLVWATVLLAGCATHPASPARVATLPTTDVLALDGRASSLKATLAGSVAVIDLWATWCTACERERPKLARLHAAYRDQGLRVVGLDVGEAPSVVSAYLGENSIPYPVYLDPDFRLADALGDKTLPTILLVDRAGNITRRSGALDRETLNELKALLAAAPAK